MLSIGFIIGGGLIFLSGESSRKESPSEMNAGSSMGEELRASSVEEPSVKSSAVSSIERPKKTAHLNEPPAKSLDDFIALTEGNFESFVLRCFQGERCHLDEDPVKLYEDFKTAGNREAMDHLISFLRQQLQNPKMKDRLKGPLLRMIQDFYSSSEQPFQEAAYYNYLGDLQKSLDLYLELEKKSIQDPTLRPAPKLNIANTYYDLGRFREALPYYRSARDELMAGPNPGYLPSTNDLVRFVEGRIEEIETKVRL